MNRRRWLLALVALALMGGGAGFIFWLQVSQTLGLPGVRIAELDNSDRVEIMFPERALGCVMEAMSALPEELGALPKDTTIGRRGFRADDGFSAILTVVLMGADRTSIHRPQICMTGQGWSIDANASEETRIDIEKPHRYQLPVRKLVATKQLKTEAGVATYRAVFVYWYVAEDRITVQDWERMFWMAGDLLTKGVLQRWAYIAYFSVCEPGREDATYDRLKELIASSVPEFQLATLPAAGQGSEGGEGGL